MGTRDKVDLKRLHHYYYTLAPSYVSASSIRQGSAAEQAASRKEAKYASLSTTYCFVPLAFETLGPIHDKSLEFLSQLGQRLSVVSGDKRERSFLLQRLSMAIQRFNYVCFKGSFIEHDVEG